MYGIGAVARIAQVSVRTLRYYDDVGLLKPAYVDPLTGYRYYTPDQVLRLHRILVLRDLGVTLPEISQLVDDSVTLEQLRRILCSRQAEVRAELTAQSEQLKRVEIRLAQLEEGAMENYDVVVKQLAPLRVLALTEDLAGYEEIGEACGRMYPKLHAALARHGAAFDGLSHAMYEVTGREDLPLRLTTALNAPSSVSIEEDGLSTIELDTVERAATTIVRGSPDRFKDAFRALHAWAEEAGEKTTPFERELYIDCDGPRDTWVTEVQVILEPRG